MYQLRKAENISMDKAKHIMRLIRPLVLILLKHNIMFSTQYITSVDNVLCDKISRLQVTDQLLEAYGKDLHPISIPRPLQPEHFDW